MPPNMTTHRSQSTTQNRNASTNQILSLEMRHLVHDGPEPALEPREALGRLPALVVEAGVGDQRGHVDVADAVQQQPQVLRRQPLQRRLGQHVQHAHAHRLKKTVVT